MSNTKTPKNTAADEDGTTYEIRTYVKRIEPEPDVDLGAVWVLYTTYTDDRMVMTRDTPPRFAADVVIDDAGQYHIDRQRVEWFDDVAEDERERLLDEYDTPSELKYNFEN